MYPEANIWVIGHSLGGALASLLGVTFGPPVVAFESPGERMASRRLHLPQPVSGTFKGPNMFMTVRSAIHTTHHARLPHRRSNCNGDLQWLSVRLFRWWLRNGEQVRTCFDVKIGLLLIYNNRCHLGRSIVYDTVSNGSWSVDIRTHTIKTVIDRILSSPWPPAVDSGREVPIAEAEEDCVVRDTI